MTELSRFFGIMIAVFYKEHGIPHVHVYYAEHVAVVSLLDGSLIVGFLPKPVLRLAMEWIYEHQSELLLAWKDAQHGKKPNKIAPMRKRRLKKR